MVWCLQKVRLFLLGCPNLAIITDHRPLVKLLGDRALRDISNPRLFRLKEKTLQFQFRIHYMPGKRNSAANFLSRYPLLKTQPGAPDEELVEDLTVAVASAISEALSHDGYVISEEMLQQAACDDPVYQLLVSKVSSGDWCPQHSQEIACLRPYYGVRERLSIVIDLVTYTYTYDQGCVRLVIPESLHQQITTHLHAGHQGLDSMLRRARQTVYWPGMNGDMQRRRDSCPLCETHTPSQPAEELVFTTPTEYPFQSMVAGLFQSEGQMYMAYADRLAGWLEVAHFSLGTTSSKIASTLRTYFARWGAQSRYLPMGGQI